MVDLLSKESPNPVEVSGQYGMFRQISWLIAGSKAGSWLGPGMACRHAPCWRRPGCATQAGAGGDRRQKEEDDPTRGSGYSPSGFKRRSPEALRMQLDM